MATSIFDDLGVRFEYPFDWEMEVVDDDGPRPTITVQAPDGLAFAMVTLDEDRPAPAQLADEALDAMRSEYPELEAVPAMETIDGHKAVGHDVEFFSLDLTNGCAIRSFRTPRRTVLILGQWSDIEGDEIESQVRVVRKSFEETDAG